MKTARRELLELLERLPDDAPMETLLAEMHFKASVLRGLEDSHRGDVVSHEEVRSRLNKWLESSGRERLSGI
jgi:predicted transcriptional regulator